MLSFWIVPYAWSYFHKDGYLQPYFSIMPHGNLRLIRCELLSSTMQRVGMWERENMPHNLTIDLELRAGQECLIPDRDATTLPVRLTPSKIGR